MTACGFTPVYGPGGSAENLRGRIAVAAPADEEGFALVRRLEERLGQPQASDLTLTVRTAQPARFSVEYDSHDRTATLAGAYTVARRLEPKGDRESPSHAFHLPAVYFANRQNGGSDFRLILRGPAVDVVSVRLDPTR